MSCHTACAVLALVAFAAGENASTATNTTANPTMSTRDGQLYFQVAKGMDVTFSRKQEDQTVTMWQVKEMIDDLTNAALPAAKARIQAYAKEKLDKVKANILAKYRSRARVAAQTIAASIEASAGAAMDTATSRLGEAERQLSSYKTQVSEAVTAIRTALDSRLKSAAEEAKAIQAKLGRKSQLLQSLQQGAATIPSVIAKVGSTARSNMGGSVATYTEVVGAAGEAFAVKVDKARKKADGSGSSGSKEPLAMKVHFVPVLNEGCDNCKVRDFTFKKVKPDTILRIAWSGDARLIGNGANGLWRILVDGKECECMSSSSADKNKCNINTRFHGSRSLNVHRTMHLEGLCFKTSGSLIKAGSHTVQLNVQSTGDAYTGWSTPSQFYVEEIPIVTQVLM